MKLHLFLLPAILFVLLVSGVFLPGPDDNRTASAMTQSGLDGPKKEHHPPRLRERLQAIAQVAANPYRGR